MLRSRLSRRYHLETRRKPLPQSLRSNSGASSRDLGFNIHSLCVGIGQAAPLCGGQPPGLLAQCAGGRAKPGASFVKARSASLLNLLVTRLTRRRRSDPSEEPYPAATLKRLGFHSFILGAMHDFLSRLPAGRFVLRTTKSFQVASTQDGRLPVLKQPLKCLMVLDTTGEAQPLPVPTPLWQARECRIQCDMPMEQCHVVVVDSLQRGGCARSLRQWPSSPRSPWRNAHGSGFACGAPAPAPRGQMPCENARTSKVVKLNSGDFRGLH